MINKKEFLEPINLVRLILAGAAFAVSTYGFFVLDSSDLVTNRRLKFVTVLLLFIFFMITGIQGLKNDNKVVRGLSIIFIIIALFVLGFNLVTVYLVLANGQNI